MDEIVRRPMLGSTTYVAFSGGADSTAMTLGLAERGEPFELLFTPTGEELPEVFAHVETVRQLVGVPLHIPPGPKLLPLIDEFQALPNPRQRWCTRMVKIQPCIAFLKRHPGSVLAVGLRADEETRTGLYGEWAAYRYPLREWGWRRKDVVGYCETRGVAVPRRTDCTFCPYQRLGEWRDLWRDHPDEYAKAEQLEERIGHTFRSPSRDTWPASLKELRGEFERGRPIRGDDKNQACRVCRA